MISSSDSGKDSNTSNHSQSQDQGQVNLKHFDFHFNLLVDSHQQ